MDVPQVYPNLLVLDLSYNSLVNMQAALMALVQLSRLSSLALMGNPMSLLKSYRLNLVVQLKSLKCVDYIKVEEWEKNIRLTDQQVALESLVRTQGKTPLLLLLHG